MKNNFLFLIFCLFVPFYLSAQWQFLGGPNTGSITRIQSLDDKLFVVTSENTLFRSDDEGKTWQFKAMPIPIYSSGLIAEGHTLYLNGSKIYKSTDYGETWSLLLFATPDEYVEKFGVHQDTLMYLNEDNQFFISVKGGNNSAWQPTGKNTIFFFSTVDQIFNSNGTWYLYGDKKMIKSDDGGKTWTICYEATQNSTFEFDVFFSDKVIWVREDKMLAGNNSTFFYSIDHGFTWLEVVPPFIPNLDLAFFYQRLTVAEGILYYEDTATHILYISNDFGVTWKSKMTSCNTCNNDNYYPFKDKLFATTSKSTLLNVSVNNGATWTTSGEGIVVSKLEKIALSQNNFWGIGYGSLYSHNLGQTKKDWKEITNISPTAFTFSIYNLTADDKTIYTNDVYETSIYSSINAGTTWKKTNTGIDDIKLLLIENDTLFATDSKAALYQTTKDKLDNWHKIYTETDSNLFFEKKYLKKWNNYLYSFISGGQFAVSEDNGSSWTATGTPNQGNQTNWIDYIQFEIVQGGVFYFDRIHSDGFYLSNDLGYNWKNIASNIPFPIDNEINIIYGHEKTLFIATRTKGLWYSKDLGKTWQPIQGLENLEIYDLVADNQTIYASTSYGVWSYPFITTATTETTTTTSNLSISPNPSNQQINVQLKGIEENTPVQVQICTVQGSIVQTQTRTVQNAALRLEISSLPNGFYTLYIRSKEGGQQGNFLVQR